MKNERIDLCMTDFDDLFMSSEERADRKKPKVEEIAISELRPFKDHPFRVKEDEEMEQLKKSIHESGVLVPALARPTEDGYELISGHRRMAACAALGMETMPVIVRKLADEEAVIAMVDSNLQREHLLPSEKAFAYKMKMEALTHQGKTSRQDGEKWSVEQISEAGNDSERQIHRYIRLTNLIPSILKMVDEGRIALTPAVELSYLNTHEQEALCQIMERDEVTPSLSQAQRLRKLSQEYTLTDAGIAQIMAEEKPNQKEQIRLQREEFSKYFPSGYSPKQIKADIIAGLDLLKRQRERSGDRESR